MFVTICFVQKDRKIDLLRKHIAMKRELAEREAREAEARDRDRDGNGGGDTGVVVAGNGTCRCDIVIVSLVHRF